MEKKYISNPIEDEETLIKFIEYSLIDQNDNYFKNNCNQIIKYESNQISKDEFYKYIFNTWYNALSKNKEYKNIINERNHIVNADQFNMYFNNISLNNIKPIDMDDSHLLRINPYKVNMHESYLNFKECIFQININPKYIYDFLIVFTDFVYNNKANCVCEYNKDNNQVTVISNLQSRDKVLNVLCKINKIYPYLFNKENKNNILYGKINSNISYHDNSKNYENSRINLIKNNVKEYFDKDKIMELTKYSFRVNDKIVSFKEYFITLLVRDYYMYDKTHNINSLMNLFDRYFNKIISCYSANENPLIINDNLKSAIIIPYTFIGKNLALLIGKIMKSKKDIGIELSSNIKSESLNKFGNENIALDINNINKMKKVDETKDLDFSQENKAKRLELINKYKELVESKNKYNYLNYIYKLRIIKKEFEETLKDSKIHYNDLTMLDDMKEKSKLIKKISR